MSLLTPSESRAFQSFLDAAAACPVDWSMQLEICHEHMHPAHGTEALTKATKDLMSLDEDKWGCALDTYSPSESSGAPALGQQRIPTNPLALLCSTRQQRSSCGNPDENELLPLYRVMNSTADPKRTRVYPNSYDHSSSSSSSRQSPVDILTSSPSTARLSKRSPPPDSKLSNKRHRPSAASQNLPDETLLLSRDKSALLSPSQKKANHIQSEQKRRANIRRGYDALCDTIPALREACQAEDAEQLADGKAKSRRRGKGKAKIDDGERIDGRAGPRSENIVLSKTIDYLHELLSEREALMQRLHAARSALPVGHPLLCPQPDAPLPLWERTWTGGEAKGNDDEDDEDDE